MKKKIQFIFHPEAQYIEGSYKGAVNADTGLKVVQATMEKMQTYNCLQVFFDATKTLSSATTAENFEFALSLSQLLEELGNFRWAIHYSNDPFMYEMVYKMVLQSGISNIYLSKDKDDALNWLLKKGAYSNH